MTHKLRIKLGFIPVLVLEFCDYFILVPQHANVLFNPSPSKFYYVVSKLYIETILVLKTNFV